MSSAEKMDEMPPPIPEGYRPLSHQVAGHIFGKCKTRAGLLQDNSGSILKLLQTNNRGMREKTFYQIVFGQDQSDPLLLGVRDLVCPFKGTVIPTEDPSVEYIKLEDMTRGFARPCIMDVKIGRIGYRDGDNAKKAEMAKIKYPHMDKLGFQVLGMRVYHPVSQKYSYYDKVYGRSLDVTSMIEGLAKFFNVEEKIRTDVMYAFLVRLQQILDWFEVQNSYHFYSSSLLFIYEGDANPDLPKSPPRPLSHSSSPTNDSRNHIPHAESAGTKPDTYPLKRKKTNKEDVDAARDPEGGRRRNKSGRDNHVRVVGEEGDKAERGGVQGNGEEGRTENRVSEEKCNGLSHCGEITEGKTCSNCNGRMNSDQNVLHEHSPQRDGLATNNALLNGPMHQLTNYSHSKPGQTKLNNHNESRKCLSGNTNSSNCSAVDGGRTCGTPVEIRMIDFAHAIESTTRDENYIFGLRMLMQYIETLHNCHVG